MQKDKIGIRNGRWHPLWAYADYKKWSETPEGKDHLEQEKLKLKELYSHRKKRINYEEELKRTDLSPLQRRKYREQLEKNNEKSI